MTKRFSKTMLRVDRYFSPDGVVDVTPNRLKHWADNFARMTEAGQAVPMHFDHSDKLEELLPVSISDLRQRKRSAANSVGHMVDFKLAPSGDSAEITVEVNDPKAVSIVESNSAQFSPVILPNWKDGAGNQYKDLITHMDIVNHPVDHSQSNAICCSLIRMGITPYRLSANDLDDDEEGEDDLMSTAMDGIEPLTEELNQDGDEADGEGDNLDAPGDMLGDPPLPGDMPGDMPGDDSIDAIALDGIDAVEADPAAMDEPVADATSDIGELVSLLQSHEIKLPGDTDSANFFDRLKTALTATADDKPIAAEYEVSQPQQGFMAMSLEQFAHKSYRQELARELNGLLKSGRATPAEIRQQVDALKVVKLSLTKTGTPAENRVSLFIENRKSLPSGAVWSPVERLSRMSASPQPEHVSSRNGELTGKALDDAVALLVR